MTLCVFVSGVLPGLSSFCLDCVYRCGSSFVSCFISWILSGSLFSSLLHTALPRQLAVIPLQPDIVDAPVLAMHPHASEWTLP
jgi:hypothetical protein